MADGAEAFLEVFATRPDGLGWERVFFDDRLDVSDPDDSGPLTVHLGDCPAVLDRACSHEADVTIERLLRRDRTGIWSVTAVEGAQLGEVPSRFVGSTEDAVVLVSARNGEILSTIAGPEVVGRRADGADFLTSEVAADPGGTGVYFRAIGGEGAERRLMFAPSTGGAPQDLGPGWDPVPSPDGTRLAYVGCPVEGCGDALQVRDLATGDETRMPTGSPDGLLTVEGWLTDGSW